MEDPGAAAVSLVLTTAPDTEVAERIARVLVEERFAACANVLPGVTSVFRWEDAVQREGEVLVFLKTTVDGVGALRDRLVELHPYDVPEVVALPVTSGHPPYLAWVREEVGPAPLSGPDR